MDAAKIRILIEANAAGVASGLAPARAALRAFETDSTRSLSRISTAFSSLTTNQKLFTGVGIGVAVISTALVASIGPAIEFQSAFAGVRKTVDGTPAQLAGIRDGLLNMSKVMPTSAAELASIAENAGQLGIKAPAVLEFTRTIAMLGETTDLSFDEAAQSLARFLNITGGDATITQIADAIVELGNNSATTESQIVALASRMASSLTLAGASEDQILGLASALSSLDVQAEAGGTAIAKIFTEMSDAAKLNNAELGVFAEVSGKTRTEMRGLIEDNPVEAFLSFAEGLNRVSEEGKSISPILEDVNLTGIRVEETLRKAASSTEFIRTQLGLASEQFTEGGAAALEYGKRVETTASRLEILQNRLAAVAVGLGTPLLDGFAKSADLAGDAVEGLVAVLSPLASSVQDTFSNAAQVVSTFYAVLGGPALMTAIAAFNGLAVATNGVLSAFNALGPAGIILAVLAADIALVGPVSILAQSALVGLGASFTGVSLSAGLAATATKAFSAALAVSPYIILVGALVAVGKAWYDAGSQAKESATGFREAASAAAAAGDLSGVTGALGDITARQAELRAQLGVTSAALSDQPGLFDRLGTAIKGTAQILTPFTDNTVINASKELDALDDVLGELSLGNFEDSINRASNALGISTGNTIALATEMGILGDLTQGTNDQFFESVAAMGLQITAQEALASAVGVTTDEILTGEVSLGQYSDALGVSAENLGFLADQIEGVDLSDLFSEDDNVRLQAFEALQGAIVGQFGEMAAAAGVTTDEFLSQIKAVSDLALAHSDLRQAVDGVLGAFEVMEAQQRITAEATASFEEALQGVAQAGGLEGAARAMRELSVEYAASGVTAVQAIANQEKLAARLLEAGLAAGYERDAIIEVITTLGLVPEEVLVQMSFEGQAAKAEVDEMQQKLEEVAGEYFALLDLDADAASGTADEIQQKLNELAAGFYEANLSVFDGASAGILSATGAAVDFADGLGGFYEANLSVFDGASSGILTATGTAGDFSDGDGGPGGSYQADLSVFDGASAGITSATGTAGDFSDGDGGPGGSYQGVLSVFDGASAGIATATGNARGYSGGSPYGADLAARDNASSVIAAAVAWLGRFNSKTITLTTVQRTIINNTIRNTAGGGATGYGVAGGPIEDGAIVLPFAAGGISGVAGSPGIPGGPGAPISMEQAIKQSVPSGAIRENPGNAKIYRPATYGRYFAERSTSGEAFIPLGSNRRATALPVFYETGRILGVFENGGITGRMPRVPPPGQAGPIVIQAPIDIVINGDGLDARTVGRMVQAGVADGLADAGRELANVLS